MTFGPPAIATGELPADGLLQQHVQRPRVLLAMAHWYGTVAAVRDLGKRGIEVHVSSNSPLRQALWSRYARGRHRSPPERDASRYLAWLLETGRRNPGAVLCATSDDLSFLHAAHESELREHFLLATPPLPILRELLDKERLHRHADKAGLRTPATVFPADASGAERLASKARFPQLLKQRTQVFSRTLHKGTPVLSTVAVREQYELFRRKNRFDPSVLERWPDADRPLLQEYLPASSERIYCVAGFIAPGGDRWAMRACMKVLSHPRYLGIGLLFEPAPLAKAMEDALIRLCRSVGYHGIFQCEFLEHQGEHLLIDFNPRFYNFMALEHARGLPQAYLAYLLAVGAHDELHRELERARVEPAGAPRTVYCYRFGTWLQLRLEWLLGRVGREEIARWRSWRHAASSTVDPVWERGDPGPAIADLLMQLWTFARHPRSSFRSNVRRAL